MFFGVICPSIRCHLSVYWLAYPPGAADLVSRPGTGVAGVEPRGNAPPLARRPGQQVQVIHFAES